MRPERKPLYNKFGLKERGNLTRRKLFVDYIKNVNDLQL